jgi:hypothetical protein
MSSQGLLMGVASSGGETYSFATASCTIALETRPEFRAQERVILSDAEELDHSWRCIGGLGGCRLRNTGARQEDCEVLEKNGAAYENRTHA